MSIKDIVNVVISRDTASLSQVGFGTILVLTPEANFSNRVQYVESADAAADILLGGSNSLAYKAFQAIFSQNPSPVRAAIGNQNSTKKVTFVGDMVAGSIVALVNGTSVTQAWTSSKAATLSALAVKIAAVTDVGSSVVAGDILTTTPTINKLLTMSFTITGTTMTAAYSVTAIDTVTQALDAIVDETNDFYAVTITSRASADQKLAADWCESRTKIFGCASSDNNIIAQTVLADTTSIAALLKAGAYARSFSIYHADATTVFPECAALGRILPLDPGTYTMKFKTLAGIAVSALSSTSSINARAKNCMTYEAVGGANILVEGATGSGEFVDTIIFIDWLTARLTENIYRILKTNDKVPYTDTGIMTIKSGVDQVLKIGQNVGGISPTAFDSNKVQIGGYYVIVPALEAITLVDKAARYLQGVKFTAFLAGAIHAVKINGVVTY